MEKSAQSAIRPIEGISLRETGCAGIMRAEVGETVNSRDLTWDRYLRLSTVARAVFQRAGKGKHRLLDVGGLDGALAIFLPDFEIDVLDPATTGSSLQTTEVKDQSYNFVVSIDVIEHIDPGERVKELDSLARVSGNHLFVNVPSPKSIEAQKTVLAATGNPFVQQHVEWPLPEPEWIISELSKRSFKSELVSYGNAGIWAGQMLVSCLVPDAAQGFNQYLIDEHTEESGIIPLYNLFICRRP